jgi:hypothetical protein
MKLTNRLLSKFWLNRTNPKSNLTIDITAHTFGILKEHLNRLANKQASKQNTPLLAWLPDLEALCLLAYLLALNYVCLLACLLLAKTV